MRQTTPAQVPSDNWQWERPTLNHCQYGTLMEVYPVMGRRLHMMHCDSHKPQGIVAWINYKGSELHGVGTILCNLQYGRRRYSIVVKEGVLHAFGMKSDLRKPFKPRIYGYEQEVLK